MLLVNCFASNMHDSVVVANVVTTSNGAKSLNFSSQSPRASDLFVYDLN
jgi:hypothetical protein